MFFNMPERADTPNPSYEKKQPTNQNFHETSWLQSCHQCWMHLLFYLFCWCRTGCAMPPYRDLSQLPPVASQDPAPAAYISSQVVVFFLGVEGLVFFLLFSGLLFLNGSRTMGMYQWWNSFGQENVWFQKFPVTTANKMKESTWRSFGNELNP